MNAERPAATSNRHWYYFAAAVTLTATLYLVYGLNMFWWRNSPDFGWRTMYNSGPNVVAQTLAGGEAAGLRVGDRIVAINGRPYSTFNELYFGIRRSEPGSVNAYTVEREGQTLEINITTGRIGIKSVLWRSGTIFLIGLVYVVIGILVFLMKPKAYESRLFLVMSCFLGVHMSYGAPSDLMHPLWLFDLRLFIDVVYPAPIIHLAMRFPRTWPLVRRLPWVWVIPYLISIAHFVLYEFTIDNYWDPAPRLDFFGNIYLLAAILIFLGSMIRNFLKDSSLIIRRQSQVILLGIILGFLIPSIDIILRFHWDAYLFPDPTIGYMIFLILFPLSIGYTIVKYDLFAIDTLIKRTYGYILTTGSIAVVYGLLVLFSDLAFGEFGITRSPTFPLIFILAVVFLFNPLRDRIQKFIDRTFYRLEYDYQDTVRKISERLRSLLKVDEILDSIIDIALNTMFIDSGRVMLLSGTKNVYECHAAEGVREIGSITTREADTFLEPDVESFQNANVVQGPYRRRVADFLKADMVLPVDEPLIQKLAERQREVTVYDLEVDPLYQDVKESCKKTFEGLQATLIVPLVYENRLTGLITLGGKKSGKFYRKEDINLLATLASQGAVALENAMLIEEVIEKERMEEELSIARDLQTSMLPADCPDIEGLEIAATSLPAREVGGDFYDFNEMGEGRLGLVIGDVTGKSVSGALVMSASRSVFRMLSEEGLGVEDTMIKANRRTKKDIKSGMFVALLYAVIDAKQKSIRLCSAGQTQPIHFSSSTGRAVLVDTEGDTFPLGILEDADYKETELLLDSGDIVVFYTDGIVEAMDEKKEIFGFDRLLELVGDSKSWSAEEVLEKILQGVNGFAGDAAQHDDLTVIVVRVAG